MTPLVTITLLTALITTLSATFSPKQRLVVDMVCGPLVFHDVGQEVCPPKELKEKVAEEDYGDDGDYEDYREEGRTFRFPAQPPKKGQDCNCVCKDVCLGLSGQCLRTGPKRLACVCELEQS